MHTGSYDLSDPGKPWLLLHLQLSYFARDVFVGILGPEELVCMSQLVPPVPIIDDSLCDPLTTHLAFFKA